MSTRELEALLQKTLHDPRITPATRRELERVFARGALDPEAVTLFCAQAIVLARASMSDPRMRDTFAWVLQLARLTQDDLPAAAKAAPASASRACFSPGEQCLDAIRDEFARA